MLKVDNKEINYNFWLILNPIPHLEWTLELREDVVVVFDHIFTFLTPCRTHSLSPGKRVAHTQYQWASQSHGRCDEISVPLKSVQRTKCMRTAQTICKVVFLSLFLSSGFPLASQCWPTAVESRWPLEQRDLEKEAVLLSLPVFFQRVGSTERGKRPREAATRNCLRKAKSEVWKFSKYLLLYLEASDV